MDSLLTETASLSDLWRLHPRGDYFLARGGDTIPPPRHMDLILTNKCNLRCEICGSQKSLDNSKTPRSHMDFKMFQQIAETVFPFLHEVELNSRGDPLLYPQIEEVLETITRHQCSFRIQHNGTLLTDSIIERLTSGYGIISLSIDAVGSLFDKVRRHGVWEKAEPGIKKLLSVRDPRRIAITFYPTITQRTVGHMLEIVEWAHRHGVDYVGFHDYDTTVGSFEEKPDAIEKESQFEKIAAFLGKEKSRLRVLHDARIIYPGRSDVPRDQVPSALKAKHVASFVNYPLDEVHSIADPKNLCPVPWQSFGVDIEGQINVCCRSQHYPFGSVTSIENFADAWFGENFRKLRDSLGRTTNAVLILPPCESCIHHYAPLASKSAHSITYTDNKAGDERGFVYERSEARPILIFRENMERFGYRSWIPLGLDPTYYTLFENDKPLGPLSSYDDVVNFGEGRYCFSNNVLFFSASDNGDPLRNDRVYTLRRNEEAPQPAEVLLDTLYRDVKNRYFALLPTSWADKAVELFENNRPLEAKQTSDLGVIANGSGAHYDLRATTLYFSTGDNSDPRQNGRRYSARLRA